MVFLRASDGYSAPAHEPRLATRMAEVPTDCGTILVFLVAFGIKAAVFHVDLAAGPYPTAPAPVTAVFAGLLTRSASTRSSVPHPGLWRQHGQGLLTAGLLMVIGILGAIAQSDIKRILSFTLVSHIGYMVLGVAVSTESGLGAAIYYVRHHIIVQTTLFLVVGSSNGRLVVAAPTQPGRAQPVLAVTFSSPHQPGRFPPFSGSGKLAVVQAGAEVGSLQLILIGGMTTNLLPCTWWCAWSKVGGPAPTPPSGLAAATGPAAVRRVRGVRQRDDVGRMPMSMLAPTWALVVVPILMTARRAARRDRPRRREPPERGQYIYRCPPTRRRPLCRQRDEVR